MTLHSCNIRTVSQQLSLGEIIYTIKRKHFLQGKKYIYYYAHVTLIYSTEKNTKLQNF